MTRHLTLLAAAALAAASAFLLSRHEARMTQSAFAPKRIFPTLAEKLETVREIQITRGKGLGGVERITLVKPDGEAFFAVAERGFFPARKARARRLLIGLSQLEAHEARTARETDHADLGLVAPEQLGSALRIALMDGEGETLANLLFGKRPREGASVLGESAIYVREEGELGIWLARGSLPLRADPRDWLALPRPAMPLESIALMEFAELAPIDTDGEAAGARRAGAARAARRFDRESASAPFRPAAHDAPGAARLLSRLRFQDVRRRETRDRPLWRVRYGDFSGRRRTISLLVAEDRLWAAFHQESDPASHRWKDWLFEIPLGQGSDLLKFFAPPPPPRQDAAPPSS